MRKGFFGTTIDIKPAKNTGTPRIFQSCAACQLYKNVLSPKMEPFGKFRKGILNIGEAPGETEDERGKQWQGKVGRLLQRTYPKFGIDLFEDCLNINSINCRPIDKDGGNRAPTSAEIACCRNRVLKVINEYKPRVIVLFGAAAVESLIGYRWKKDLGGISKWRGWQIPDRDFDAWVCPVYHPSFVERSGKEVETIWENDLESISELTSGPSKAVDEQSQVSIISDLSIVSNRIRDNKIDRICIDFETTGLKPQDIGHKIVCASAALGPEESYAFMVDDAKNFQEFLDILSNGTIMKIAHQLKFEDTWSNVIFNTQINGWFWDTMLTAHILDNRPDITNLEFQVYAHFGNITFKNDTDPFLEAADKKNGNAKNRIMELISTKSGRDKLLMRCGLDSLYEYRLSLLQIETIRKNRSKR